MYPSLPWLKSVSPCAAFCTTVISPSAWTLDFGARFHMPLHTVQEVPYRYDRITWPFWLIANTKSKLLPLTFPATGAPRVNPDRDGILLQAEVHVLLFAAVC